MVYSVHRYHKFVVGLFTVKQSYFMSLCLHAHVVHSYMLYQPSVSRHLYVCVVS